MKTILYKLFAIGVVLVCFTLSPMLLAAEYDYTIAFDRISFEWKLDGKMIHIRLKAKTKGWVAIGFNPKDGMEGADYVIGYVKRGKVKIQDAFGIRDVEHIRDVVNNGSDDVKNISGSESGEYTTISFTIPLNSGDENDSTLTPDSDTVVLLAFGPERDSFFTRHVYRTALSVNLKTGLQKEVEY